MDYKEMKKIIIAQGWAEWASANPEGGFYGNQSWLEVTPAGHKAGLVINRSCRDCGAGEIGYISSVRLRDKYLWREGK